ncbi:MauE/DoxX family redox-associated membrane protein [Zeaxanthinibacter enoshimensis]|uniref:DoxX family protein n=1 Tax=Zeaxanthinibacter enoshimensis TaxID=392009 RepID=UPI003567E875
MNYPWHLYLMSAMFILAGIMHFIYPKAYLRIMPRYLPRPLTLVYASGIAEIALGIGLCFPATINYSVYGILLMLTVFLLVHIHMLTGKKAAAGFPVWLLVLRLPVQFLLIYWAYSYLYI